MNRTTDIMRLPAKGGGKLILRRTRATFSRSRIWEEKGITSVLLVSVLLLFMICSAAELQAAPYYEGKSIAILVGYGPGGGYDRMARMLAKHLPKFIPGKPSIIVQNMPGANSMIVTNHIYNIAKPDGLTIGTFDRGMPFAQLLKAPGIRFDLSKFSWIGSAAIETRTFALRTDLPYKTFNDLLKLKSPLMIGSTGPAESGFQFSVLLRDFLGVNLKMITYPSHADVLLAVERKELDGLAPSYNSIGPYLDKKLVRLFIRGRNSVPAIENLPVDEELATNAMGKTMMAIFSGTDTIGRPYVAPPRTPQRIVDIIREAFAKVAQDPELQAESKRLMMAVQYVPAAECLKAVNFTLNQPEETVREISKYIK